MGKLIHKSKQSLNKCSGGGNFSCRHPRVYKWLISNIKAFFIGGAISFVLTASATVILHSRQVRYKNDKSVEQAINEVYQKADKLGLILLDNNGYRYEKVEYLESTGTQYIDTGIFSMNNIRINLTFETSSIKKYQVILGVNSGINFKIYGDSISLNDGTIIEEYNPNLNNCYIDFECGMDESLNRYLLYNEKIYYNTSGKKINNSIYIFGLNYNNQLFKGDGITASYSAPFIGKIYYLTMFLNNAIVRDYIPVLDKNDIPCLFDKVSKTCFYNQGTGEFLYG